MFQWWSDVGTRALSVASPTIWNSLSGLLHDLSVESKHFRRDLKTHLFREHEYIIAVTISGNCTIHIEIYLLTYLQNCLLVKTDTQLGSVDLWASDDPVTYRVKLAGRCGDFSPNGQCTCLSTIGNRVLTVTDKA